MLILLAFVDPDFLGVLPTGTELRLSIVIDAVLYWLAFEFSRRSFEAPLRFSKLKSLEILMFVMMLSRVSLLTFAFFPRLPLTRLGFSSKAAGAFLYPDMLKPEAPLLESSLRWMLRVSGEAVPETELRAPFVLT